MDTIVNLIPILDAGWHALLTWTFIGYLIYRLIRPRKKDPLL